jgi:hypothetical protein
MQEYTFKKKYYANNVYYQKYKMVHIAPSKCGKFFVFLTQLKIIKIARIPVTLILLSILYVYIS